MSRGCRIAAVMVQALSLGIAGCHQHATVASQQAPPPVNAGSTPATSGGHPGTLRPVHLPGSTADASSHAGAGNSAGTAPALAVPPAAAVGKPVSTEVGMASWYGPPYTNRKAADGSVYDQNAMTAAHRTLPMGSVVRVTNLANNQSALVRITDRGPFVDGRIIDLSLAAAKATGVYRAGVAKVRVEAYAPPVKPGVDPGGKWCVQVGAFADQAKAVKLKEDLMRRYATAKVIEFPGPTGHWVRINAQNPDKATASRISEGIHVGEAGVQPYLVRLN